MRSPDRRALALWLAIVAGAGCTDHAGTTPASSTPQATTSIAQQSAPAELAPPVPTSADPSATTDLAGQGAAVPVAVTGGHLPAEVVEGYARNGGDLVDPSEWRTRFGRGPLPELTGPGVRLVEGVRRWARRDGRWVQTDEAGWLAMSRDGRDLMMRSLADAAAISGTASRGASGEQGADCVLDTYRPDVGAVTWQVQGCSYDNFPGLLSLGVSRSGPSSEPPTAIDGTIGPVATALDASVTFVEATLGEPGADGSTLRLSAHLTDGMALEPAVNAVPAALADWQSFPGEDSMLLSGPSGATWTLSDSVAVFTWEGRW